MNDNNTKTDAPRLPPIAMAAMSEGSAGTSAKDKAPNETPGPEWTRDHWNTEKHRFLSAAEWSTIAHGLGGVRDGESDKPCHPTHWLWPPIGMPQGLYREVVSHRYRFYFLFHLTSILRLTLLVSQLLLGAALTALGAMSLQDGKSITFLGATNTVVAGCIAFMHNSGLPDRYWSDKVEFEDIEDRIREILDSRTVPVGLPAEQVLAECFDRFRHAKSTVAINLPANYAASKQMLPSAGRVPPVAEVPAKADEPKASASKTS